MTLVSTVIVLALQIVSASANPFSLYPWDPHTKVSIMSPTENAKLSSNNITLTFNVDLSLWYTEVVSRRNPTYRCYVWFIKYYLDGKMAGNTFGSLDNDLSGTHSVLLTGIAEGKHNLGVDVSTAGGHWQRSAINNSWSSSNAAVEDSSNLIYFTIDVTPIISNLSVENKTYYSNQIPLIFNVNAPFFRISYSLDNSSNIAVTGNTTLSISQGSHNIVVSTKDAAGNMWKSDKVFFTVITLSPSPSLFAFPCSNSAGITRTNSNSPNQNSKQYGS